MMNMNADIEKYIIKTFVKKEKQERIIWELQNPQKRDAVFWRFSGPNLFKEQYIQPFPPSTTSLTETALLKMGCKQTVYFLGESFIGELSLKQAIEKANIGERCIIYCREGVCYYQGERELGNAPKCFLIHNK